MDPRERLRRYLEQRRELGESELVLDSLSVDDVLSLVSARGALKRRAKPDPDVPPAAAPPRATPPAAAETEQPRSALPTAFRPAPDEASDEAADEASDEASEEAGAAEEHDDAGAPADHPRLHGEGAPGVQDLRAASPAVPEPEERGGRARDLVLEGADAGDWRTTLRGAGGAPPTRPARPTDPAPEEARSVPARRPAAAADAAPPAAATGGLRTGTPFPGLDDVPVGIVFDGGDAPMFDDGGIRSLPSLDSIAETVRGCTRCPLYKTATHGVPGEGNPEADFVVVGEAPGADEDASGRPFVGASGQLLTKILAAINLAREDVFICNVVKHRPPGNRNPAPDEVAACSPYLIRQLELVRPKVILTVGNFAAQTLLGTKLGIGKLRGQVHLYRGVPLVATYHPAALLRNPTWKRPTWEDVQLARRLLDRAAPPG
jgi:DNA polymerase